MKLYHYTNDLAFEKMKIPREKEEDYIHFGPQYVNFRGLLPSHRRFINLFWGGDLPKKAGMGAIEGLLEEAPDSWVKNTECPHTWECLMHDIWAKGHKDMILLRCELTSDDDAYILDRGLIEKVLHTPSDTRDPKKELIRPAAKEYWNTKVRPSKYKGGFMMPQFAVFSPIAFERLEIVWKKPSRAFYEEAMKQSELNKKNQPILLSSK